MKATINESKQFEPFDLTITIESKRELEFLWCIFNSPYAKHAIFANDNIHGGISIFNVSEFGRDGISTMDLWKILDNKLKQIQ